MWWGDLTGKMVDQSPQKTEHLSVIVSGYNPSRWLDPAKKSTRQPLFKKQLPVHIGIRRRVQLWKTTRWKLNSLICVCRRKFRSQTSDNMDRWKSRGGKSQRREEKRREEERRSEKRKRQKTEDAGARKGSKVAKHYVFQWFVAPEGQKVGSLKRRVEPPGQMREKLHPVVARSTFRSQNVQNTTDSEHFWKLRCWKSARRCGTKHIWKEKM